MTSPGGTEVGRVSVRVLPDTSRFRRDLQRDLKAEKFSLEIPVNFDLDKEELRRKLEALRVRAVTIPAEVKLDRAQIREAITAATAGQRGDPIELTVKLTRKAVKEAVTEATSGVAGSPVRLAVALDKGQIKRELERATTGLGPVKVPIEFDRKQIEAELKSATAGLRAGDLEMPLGLDMRGLDRDIRAALGRAQGQLDAADLQAVIDANIKLLSAKIAQAERQLEDLRTRGRDIVIDADAAPVRKKIQDVEDKLEALRAKKFTPEIQVKIDQAERELARLTAELARIENRDVSADVDLKVAGAEANLARLRAQLTKLENTRTEHTVDIKVNKSALDEIKSSIFGNGGRGGAINRLTDMFQGLPDFVAGALTSVVKLGAGVIKLGGAFRTLFDSSLTGFEALRGFAVKGAAAVLTIGIAAGQASLAILAMGVASEVIAALGAAITAAFAAVSTAIVELPGLIIALAIPIATVATGLDGIKKAAAVLKPGFEDLKTSVSATFEKGMLPVFKQLATIFPTLKVGMNGVATAIVGVAESLTKIVTSQPGITQVSMAFANAKSMVEGMRPGLDALVQAFLKIASMREPFDLLASAITTFGTEFKKMVDELDRTNDLQAAFKGLQGVVDALLTSLISLVKNGVEAFAHAAPGVEAFIRNLGEFFDRFDWDSLGASVGGVFQGIADAIKGIPQSTIDGIAAGFERISKAFQDPSVKLALQNIAAALPGVLDFMARLIVASADVINWLARVLPQVAAFARGTEQVFLGLGKFIHGVATAIVGSLEVVGVALNPATWIGPHAAEAQAEMHRLADGVQAGLDEITQVFTKYEAPPLNLSPATQGVNVELAKLAPSATTSLHNMDEAINRGSQNAGATLSSGLSALPPLAATELGKIPPAADQSLTPLQNLDAVNAMTPQFQTAGVTSMNALAVGIQSGLAIVQQKFTEGFDTISSGVSGSFTLINKGVTVGMASMAQGVTLGFTAITESFNLGFDGATQAVTAKFVSMNQTVLAQMAAMSVQVQSGMALVQQAFTLGFDTISTSLNTSFQLILSAVPIHMNNFALAITNGMTVVAQAFQTGFIGVGETVSTQFGLLTQNAALGMDLIVVAITDGFVRVTEAYRAGFESVKTAQAEQFTLLAQTATTGMDGIVLAVTNGFVRVSDAVTVGFAGIGDSVQQSMDLIVSTVSIGMENWSKAVSDGFAGISATTTAQMDSIATSISTSLSTITETWRTSVQGWVDVVTQQMEVIRSGIAQQMQSIQTTVTDSLKSISDSWRSSWDTMTQTAKSSMDAVTAAVKTGMDNVKRTITDGLAAAVAALRAAESDFRSAGENMGQALADGLNSKVGAVQAAAAKLADAASAATAAAAKINSPSKVFIELGKYLGLGFALGISKMEDKVGAAAEALADTAASAVSGVGAAMGKDISMAASPYLNDWSALTGGVSSSLSSTAATEAGSLVGNMYVQTPAGVSAQQMMDQALFQLRHVRRGVYSGR